MEDYTYTLLSPTEKYNYTDDVSELVDEYASDFTPWDEYRRSKG